ncbi:hypothetical protein FOL47_000890 [Perkinsus chesapeaki]|uniref:Uncharacterized protein n=1 Tax=Perkinsus chesapeaki TaxID=330153 RepID=A0A7J6MKK5_PERCH|nr:hypothetical protein FOL47_000890 [Perkinsus chesapeaki]
MRALLALVFLHGGSSQNVTTTAGPTNTSTTISSTTTTGAPRNYCPDTFCVDSRWIGTSKKPQCIFPSPDDLVPCWNNYCVDQAKDLNTSTQGAFCKDWQDPAGRVCYPLSNLTCNCSSLRHFDPKVFSPGQQPSGWVSVDCVYPTLPPTTTAAPSTTTPTRPPGPGPTSAGPTTPSSDAQSLLGYCALIPHVLAVLAWLPFL